MHIINMKNKHNILQMKKIYLKSRMFNIYTKNSYNN